MQHLELFQNAAALAAALASRCLIREGWSTVHIGGGGTAHAGYSLHRFCNQQGEAIFLHLRWDTPDAFDITRLDAPTEVRVEAMLDEGRRLWLLGVRSMGFANE